MNMRNYTRFSAYLLRILLLVPIIFLASCGGSDDDETTSDGGTTSTSSSSPTDIAAITDDEAKSAATRLISQNFNTSITTISDVTSNSSAVDTIASSLGLDLASLDASTASVRAVRETDDSTTAAVEQQLIDALDAMIDNGIRNGATITYDPDEEALCNDAMLGLLPDTVGLIDEDELSSSEVLEACQDFYKDITVELTILGEESGTLVIKMYGFTLLTIGYSVDESYAELDLAQIKSIIEAVDNDQGLAEDPDLPGTMEGVVRLTNTVLGTDHTRMTLSFEESINIVDDSGDKETSVQLASTDRVIELEANANDNTASFEMSLATIEALYPADDDDGVEQQAELYIDGLTLLAELSSSGDQLVVSNISLGNRPMLLDIIAPTTFIITDDPTDLELTMSNFGFSINGTEASITFNGLFDAMMDMDDQFGIFSSDRIAGSLDVNINDNTVLTSKLNSSEDPILEVTSGYVSQAGTGDFGSGDYFTQGQCFSLNMSALFSPDLPFTPESCF